MRTTKTTEAVVTRIEDFLGERPRIYGGKHTKKCQCNLCVRGRLAEYEERARLAVAGGARITSADQTVPVRSHFRAQPNHLSKDAALLALVEQIVRRVMAEQKKGH